FFITATSTTQLYPLSLHDALPIYQVHGAMGFTQEHPLHFATRRLWAWRDEWGAESYWQERIGRMICAAGGEGFWPLLADRRPALDRKSTRLNSSHRTISYAVFCLK